MVVAFRTRLMPGFVTAVAAGLALLAGSPAAAQQSTVDFTVSGTSTVRGWTCSVSGTAAVTPGSSAPAPGFADGVQSATLTVPVADFECPDETMTEHLMEAMKPAEFAEITFQLDSYDASGQGAEASGALTIQGVTMPVSFPLSLTPSGAGVEIAGEVGLDMTEYGVEPPVVLLGLLRVRPEIRIQFEGLVVP
ncbi:MAG: YceI family protein [Acidobacteria bacterium]|nr:YceI family protein [Acidobacteriota bacterium]